MTLQIHEVKLQDYQVRKNLLKRQNQPAQLRKQNALNRMRETEIENDSVSAEIQSLERFKQRTQIHCSEKG